MLFSRWLYQKLDQILPFILTVGLSSVQIFHSYETNSDLGIEEMVSDIRVF
jgi:hypothetical protein